MEQYISKSALLAEIEKGKRMCDNHYSDYWNGCYNTFTDILSFIDTLEVKEAGLEKEIDLDAAIEAYMDKKFGESWVGVRPVRSFELITIAKYFFKLGLKAQKGEEV